MENMKNCVQCGKILALTSIEDPLFYCVEPVCPNYALLAIPREDMPEEEVLDPNQK